MKGYRFYLEYETPRLKRQATVKNPGEHDGNCIAIFTDVKPRVEQGIFNTIVHDCFGAVYYHRNSEVCTTSISDEFLRTRCKRIPEKLAREIHPALFKHIEYCEQCAQ